ncbi:MAG: type II toxin-antitoxin system death-on-curing family toxin [Caldilineaceae bacterium]|nr:type II toxin-antitoxin system death-on-curing family toxin [Caldilineaceae bacterium]
MTASPRFITKEIAFLLHARSIEEHGGSHGLRDAGGFESALVAAENRYLYEEASLTVCAATYAYHLTKAHAFIDGNKRIAAAVAETFLEWNGSWLDASNDEVVDLFLAIAAGECTREEVEAFFHEKTKTQ